MSEFKAKIDPKQIVGTWSLVDHGYVGQDGLFARTGQNMIGQLTYTSDFSMNVLITKTASPTSLEDIIAYSGKFSLQSGKVLHHIEVASNISRVGTIEVRQLEFQDKHLILRSEPTNQGYFEITWQQK